MRATSAADPLTAPCTPDRRAAGAQQVLTPAGRASSWRAPSIAAAFFDVDGTTLGTQPEASSLLVEAWGWARRAGVVLGFATGRLPRGMQQLERQVQANSYNVVHNGAAVSVAGRVVQTWPLPAGVAPLARWLLEQGLYAEFFTHDRMYATDDRVAARVCWEEVSGDPDAFLDHDQIDGLQAVKGTVNVFETDRLAEVVQRIEQAGLTAEVSWTPLLPGVPVVNITASGITKGSALQWVAQRLNTSLEHVLAVGDGENDLSMFAQVGTAVAMGQAGEQVRNQAHFTTAPFAGEGAARVLELLATGWPHPSPR